MKYIKSLCVVSAALAFSMLTVNLQAAPISDYIKDYPWVGLISDEITYGPVTVSHIHIKNSDKLVIATPGEVLHGNLRYKINSDKEKISFHHLVIGIEGEGAQDCIMHSMGLWDNKGKGKFTLTAPTEPGIYEVRFLYDEGLTCSKAREAWNSGAKDPSSLATIGAIIVRPEGK